MEQLDLLEVIADDELIQERLKHLYILLEQHNRLDINIVAINKYYDWSCLVKEGNTYYSYSIFHNRIERHQFGYPFERVANRTLNFILI